MTSRHHELGQVMDGRRSSGVWGAAAGALVLGILVAYFLYAHLYLSISAERWPPEGTPSLPLLRPAGLVALVVVVAALAVRAGRPLRADDDQAPLAGLLGTTAVLGGLAVAAGGAHVASLGVAPGEVAHDASLAVLHAIAGAAALAGVAIAGLAAYQAARLGTHPWVAAAAAASSIWWTTVALVWLGVAAVAYGWPQLTGGGG